MTPCLLILIVQTTQLACSCGHSKVTIVGMVVAGQVKVTIVGMVVAGQVKVTIGMVVAGQVQ